MARDLRLAEQKIADHVVGQPGASKVLYLGKSPGELPYAEVSNHPSFPGMLIEVSQYDEPETPKFRTVRILHTLAGGIKVNVLVTPNNVITSEGVTMTRKEWVAHHDAIQKAMEALARHDK